ncbi:hypothetical protein EAF04_003877 [Stromatinia cepivora]|nr:hypothetical protein EAF04_003877 [Stromatinia cepivora]
MIPLDQTPCGIWKTGRFHNDELRHRERDLWIQGDENVVLRRSSVTILGVVDCFQAWSAENWTMLLLTPRTCNVDKGIYKDGSRVVDREFLVAFSGITDLGTRRVIQQWNILANHSEMLLSERDALLQPEVHDLLLVDDSKYTKSKRYFWAMNMLREIDSDIAAVISQLRGFMDFSDNSLLHKYYPLPKGKMSEEREKIVVQTLGILREDLVNLQGRFKGQREIAIALRDGMFNASAFMETRASTRLGENIKLLTFVSIFYLPLSFTMSIWSINNGALAHVDIMIGVAITLAVITYIIVFNLNNIVFLISKTIKKLKARSIKHMKANGDEKWKRRGDELTETVFANEKNAMPSSWRFVQYVWLLVWKWFTAIATRPWNGLKQICERLVKKKVEQTQQSV